MLGNFSLNSINDIFLLISDRSSTRHDSEARIDLQLSINLFSDFCIYLLISDKLSTLCDSEYDIDLRLSINLFSDFSIFLLIPDKLSTLHVMKSPKI